MKTKSILGFLLIFFVFCGSVPGFSAPTSSPLRIKTQMLSHLEFIRHVLQTKYAPTEWKKQYSGWDIDREVDAAKTKVLRQNNPTLKDYQVILRDLFNTTQDYHVSIRFFSTEEANLPFYVKSAQNRYFITYVFKDHLPESAGDLSVGDEITTFNGKPVHEVVQNLRKEELGNNVIETDQALAEIILTNRDGSRGCKVPSGPVTIGVKKKLTNEFKQYTLTWNYTPEKIRDATKVGMQMAVRANSQPSSDWKTQLRKNPLFNKQMVATAWNQSSHPRVGNTHSIGARKSYIPSLGRKIWKTDDDSPFHAYLFTIPSGETIGFLRIPHYMGDEIDLEELEKIINLFQRRSSALVIDQINNPGGSLFYLYAIASMLTDQDLYAPRHHIAITQEEVDFAVSFLPLFQVIRDDASAKDLLGESFDGYPIDYQFSQLMKDFCHLVINEWNEGNIYTKPTHIFGVDAVQPHPKARYTKPILLVTNSLCFSGGDFFPAILQDNKRGTVFGTRTAGAGGYVYGMSFPNLLGIRDIHLTGSLCERIDQQPIENLGIKPDISYTLSIKDLQDNYQEYAQNILSALNKIKDSKK